MYYLMGTELQFSSRDLLYNNVNVHATELYTLKYLIWLNFTLCVFYHSWDFFKFLNRGNKTEKHAYSNVYFSIIHNSDTTNETKVYYKENGWVIYDIFMP